MGIFDWLAVIAALVLIGKALEKEVYFYEGAHLGPRVQSWLYNSWAKEYDEGKRESQLRDNELLAQPLLAALQNIPAPFVLDFATGTGRLSYALAGRTEFNGSIIALDLSQGMLEQAASKLSGHSDCIEFLRHQSLPLPFPDESFDVVCALEVLELFPAMDEPLAEFSRVLRPGGVFLTSRGTEESGRKAKVKNVKEYTSLLEKNRFENVQITKWWKLFDRVIAMKNGASIPAEKHELQGLLQCSSCKQIQWERTSNVMKCGNCRKALSITKDGIILN